MKHILLFLLLLWCGSASADTWPDGTPIDAWFSDTTKVDVRSLGRQYVITDYGVSGNPTLVQTKAIQAVIDRCQREGGGVVVIPAGTFLSGALFFKPGTHLHLCEGATLKGSDRIADFPVLTTRFEGETCKYFASGYGGSGIPPAPTRTHSARDWYISATPVASPYRTCI